MARIRDASYGELPQITHVLTQSFWNDSLFGDMMHPNRAEFPDGMGLWWLRRYRVDFWDYRQVFLVALDKDATGNDIIVGFAQWSRLGDGGRNMDTWWFDPRNLLKPAASMAMKVHKLLWPDLAADPANEDILERAAPYIKHAWTGDRAECWTLNWLGIHPDYQGRGHGQALVLWGLDRAERQNAWASVIAAEGKDSFYQKCGFEFVEGTGSMGDGNPLAGRPGGNIHWKAPKENV